MQNYRNRNFKKHENVDGSFTYVITVDGEKVEVSKDIYAAYAEGGYKMENTEFGVKRDRVLKDSAGNAVRDENGNAVILPEREMSLDKLIEEDWEFASPILSPEEAVFSSEESETEELYRCIALLDDDEQALVQAIFFDGMTERKYAEKLGISKTALHARKIKILEKIKNFFRS